MRAGIESRGSRSAESVSPRKVTVPVSAGARKFRQRRSVLLPDPLGPITTSTSPLRTPTSTSLSTCSSCVRPRWNHLFSPSPRTISSLAASAASAAGADAPAGPVSPDMPVESTFDQRGGGRDHEDDRQVEEGDEGVELERCAVVADELVRDAHQVGRADDRDDRRVLDDVDQLVDEAREGYAERLREDDREELVPAAEAEAQRRLPLAGIDCVERGAVELGPVRRVEHRQSDHAGGQRAEVDPEPGRDSEVDPEDVDVQR